MKNKIIFPLTILTIMTALAFVSPIFSNPFSINLEKRLSSPDSNNILGTDELGRDLFARLTYGSRISIELTFISLFFAIGLGGLLGGIAGYYGGFPDFTITKIMDVLLSLPGILLAIVIMTFFKRGELSLIFALTTTSWISYARTSRTISANLRETNFVESAKISGGGFYYIFKHHIFPNLFPVLFTQATVGAATIIMTESSLSFLGLGLLPPTPSIGGIISSGCDYLLESPHIIIFSSFYLLVLLWSLYRIADVLRESFYGE